MRLLLAATLFLSISYSEIATAQLNCETFTLDGDNDSIAAPDASFAVKNTGSSPVDIVYNAGQNRVMTIEGGSGTFFVGNENFNYVIVLADGGDSTTIEICN